MGKTTSLSSLTTQAPSPKHQKARFDGLHLLSQHSSGQIGGTDTTAWKLKARQPGVQRIHKRPCLNKGSKPSKLFWPASEYCGRQAGRQIQTHIHRLRHTDTHTPQHDGTIKMTQQVNKLEFSLQDPHSKGTDSHKLSPNFLMHTWFNNATCSVFYCMWHPGPYEWKSSTLLLLSYNSNAYKFWIWWCIFGLGVALWEWVGGGGHTL